MWKKRISALIVLVVGFGIGYFVYISEVGIVPETGAKSTITEKYGFKLGLDLSGGSHLIYRADVSALSGGDIKESMTSLRDVIERRVNIFGVSEPVVQVESGGFANAGEERLIVDLPGVTNIDKAIAMIGQTPLLEFRTESPGTVEDIQNAALDENGNISVNIADRYENTELTGRYLKRADLQFDPNTQMPIIGLQFDDEGAKLFEKITGENIGKTVAIFLDGAPLSTPVVQEAISGGQAVITGRFTPVEARTLVGRLNSGALPVPIELISTQTIGATLGADAINAGIYAGLVGVIAIALFFILWYRLPGIIAVLSLSVYVITMLALFKIIPVTLTAPGIAGFIISIGVAVDANVLIFERLKEEMKKGLSISEAIKSGFSHAWDSIRDSSTSTILTAIILFWFGTSLIKGFALTLGLGVLISLISAIVVSKVFLFSLGIKDSKLTRFLFSSGISK